MARGRRIAEEDETWRPSKEDTIEEYDDEILEEEEMGDEIVTSKEHTPSRASPQAPATRKKPTATHRKKRQEDDAWKPTDEDLEDEELEVQEMVNKQLMEDSRTEEKPKKKKASPKSKSPRKKPVGRPTHQDDGEWKPEGEDLDFEESEEEEESPCEESADDEPTAARRTPPRKAKKRPATSSAGSPEQQRTKPAKQSTASPEPPQAASPKHRLTTASNKKSPEFLVRGQNEQALFTFAAYRGEGMVMLAMNWKQGTPPDDFVGWVIEYTEPQSSKWWSIPVSWLDACRHVMQYITLTVDLEVELHDFSR